MANIKLAVIGLGRLGKEHAKNIKNHIPNVELYAISRENKSKLEEDKRKLDVKYAFSNYRDLIKLDDIDGLIIATNSSSHCEIVCEAAKAGIKNIFLEKPLGMTLEEIDIIKKTLYENNVRIFQIGFNRRFDKSLIEMKKIIESGKIGDPIIIKTTSKDSLMKEEELLKYSPSSGGLVFDMLTHDYDICKWLIESEVKTIYGLGGVYKYQGLKKLKDIDNCSLSLEFDNKVMGFMEASRNSHSGYIGQVEVFGTKGAVRSGYNPEKTRLSLYDSKGKREEYSRDFFEFWEETFLEEMKHFVDCIKRNKTPKVSIKEAYDAVNWALVARESVDKNKKLEYGVV